jgi:hypothetical protein
VLVWKFLLCGYVIINFLLFEAWNIFDVFLSTIMVQGILHAFQGCFFFLTKDRSPLKLRKWLGLGHMTKAYNVSYSGGRDPEHHGPRPVQAKSP